MMEKHVRGWVGDTQGRMSGWVDALRDDWMGGRVNG